MARRSNKTAHVLNLLAGHDSQNTTEDTAANEAAPSPSEAVPEKKAGQPAEKAEKKSDTAQPAKAEPEPALPNTPVSAQNISVIDTTGTDPVAELIQQELTNQFESELAAIAPGAAANTMTGEQDKGQETAETTESVTADPAPVTQASAEVPDTTAADSPTAAGVLDTAAADSPAAAQVTMPAQAAEETLKPHTEDSVTADPDTVKAAALQPEPETTPEPEVMPETETTPEPEAAPETETVPRPKPEEPEVAAAADTTAATEPEPDFVYLNIMEEIVKDKIIYFMRQFDLCTCDRCKADTIALTMNGLMPKYIVTTPAAVAPLVSYYTNRLISDVTVEAIKACMTVKDNPRH